jgi:hypothetical protein
VQVSALRRCGRKRGDRRTEASERKGNVQARQPGPQVGQIGPWIRAAGCNPRQLGCSSAGESPEHPPHRSGAVGVPTRPKPSTSVSRLPRVCRTPTCQIALGHNRTGESLRPARTSRESSGARVRLPQVGIARDASHARKARRRGDRPTRDNALLFQRKENCAECAKASDHCIRTQSRAKAAQRFRSERSQPPRLIGAEVALFTM